MTELLFGQINGIHAAAAFFFAAGFALYMAARGDRRAAIADEPIDFGPDTDATYRAAVHVPEGRVRHV